MENRSPASSDSADPPPRLRIGLTGGIGSGKSTVAAMLGALGAGVIDSDAISRELTAPGGAAIGPIAAAFGAEFIGADGALDRARMRRRVFADPQARGRLEGILHPLIGARGEQRARELAPRAPYLVFDIPLLAESAVPGRFDRVLVVDCTLELQVERAAARSSLGESEVRAIAGQQAGRARRLALADDVIFNAGTLQALEARVARLHRVYAGGV
jgi:dephospho-CoA kinase